MDCFGGNLLNFLSDRQTNTFINCSSRLYTMLALISLFWVIYSQMYHHVPTKRSSDDEVFINERGVLVKMLAGALFAWTIYWSLNDTHAALGSALMWGYWAYVITAFVAFITAPFPSTV